MKAMVYAKSCIQCGLCVSVCPEVFSLLPGQTAVARDEDIPTDLQLSVQAAAEGCLRMPFPCNNLRKKPYFFKNQALQDAMSVVS